MVRAAARWVTGDMFGKFLRPAFGRRAVATGPAAFEEPPALVIARRKRVLGADWTQAKSWFGGLPKLGDTLWPRDTKGTPLYFLAQLDLSEIAVAGKGRTALPTEGSLAFFVGGEKLGGIIHVRHPGQHSTPEPDDLCQAEDIGGDPLVDRSHRHGPSSFPFWPVEFHALPSVRRVSDPDDEVMERARAEQAQAIARLFETRKYHFSPQDAAATGTVGEAPIYWLSALMCAERVPRLRDRVVKARARAAGYIETSTARMMALEAGLPPPAGQPRFGDPATERANSENWLAIGRKTLAEADANAAAVDAYVARVESTAMGSDPWQEISPKDVERLDDLFGKARSKTLKSFSKYLLPHTWRDYAKDAIKLMAAGPEEAYASLPEAWRDIINTRYRLPAGGAHLMFGIGADIQGNEMFERPDMRMVLQLHNDDMMYWPFGDGGVYQFWMPVGALRAGDFENARVTFEAH